LRDWGLKVGRDSGEPSAVPLLRGPSGAGMVECWETGQYSMRTCFEIRELWTWIAKGSFAFESARTVLAEGPGGYVF